MPLTVAVEWIGRRGGNATFDPSDAQAWRAPVGDLLGAAQRGELTVWGLREGDATRAPESIVPATFSIGWQSPSEPTPLARIFYEDDDASLVFGDCSEWPSGRGDTISAGRKIVWSRLVVAKAEVLRLWRFPALCAPAGTDDEIRAVIRAAMAESGGFIGQDKGAESVRRAFPGCDRSRARRLVKETTGNEKPGPKGPRKNRAKNRA